MTVKLDPDDTTYALAERFLITFTALRGHIATQSFLTQSIGLSHNQIKTLHLVFHRPGITQTVVAERLGVTTASISTSVRELEAHGLIERRADPADARVMLLYLAPQGQKIFETFFESFLKVFADLLGKLTPEKQEQLVCLMEEALTNNGISLDKKTLNYADRLQWIKSGNPSC